MTKRMAISTASDVFVILIASPEVNYESNKVARKRKHGTG